MEQTGKDDPLQSAPASCYSSALSSTDLTPGLSLLPPEMSYIPMRSIPGIQEGTEGVGCAPAIPAHLQGRELEQPNPSEIKLALQHSDESFDTRYTKAGRSIGCFLSSSRE